MSRKLSGSAMHELVTGDKLKRVDILVTRSKGSLLGWLIRFGTRSYWNHTAMVYVIRDPKDEYDNTFIIESGGGGIDIHNIAQYFKNPKKYDVGIKRLEKDWFQAGTLDYPRKVRGLALQEIDDKYDYGMILGIGRKIIRQFILGIMFLQVRLRPQEKRRLRSPRLAKLFRVQAYICSGFVQWSFYTTVVKAINSGKADNQQLQDVMFNPELKQDDSEAVLLSTTPADVANSDKLSWKYVIKNGVVWEVTDDKDVESVIAGKG